MKPKKPLEGICVLDFSRVLSGPFSTMLLADMGADVIKVEPPVGDETRAWGPPYQNGESAYYMSTNRNKRSIVLDLTKESGRKAAQQLALRADVVIENFRPGKTKKLGIDYETLSANNPNLVYCSISGFGQESPLSDKPGYDYIAQAMSGLMSITGEPNGDPMKAGIPTADLSTGLFATIAILGALSGVQRHGQGEYIDLSLFDCQLAMLAQTAANYLVSGNTPKRQGNAHANLAPYQPFNTLDGSIVVAVGNDKQFQRFCKLLGHPEWATDPRFHINDVRVRNREQLVACISEVIAKQPSETWLKLLSEQEVPCGPIHSVPEALQMPHTAARNMVWQMSHPEVGEVSMLGNPIHFTKATLGVERPAPKFGEHTREILAEIGFSNDEIEEMCSTQTGVK